MLLAFAETSSPMRSQLNDPFKHLQFSMHDIFSTISDLIGQLEHVASPLSKRCMLLQILLFYDFISTTIMHAPCFCSFDVEHH